MFKNNLDSFNVTFLHLYLQNYKRYILAFIFTKL